QVRAVGEPAHRSARNHHADRQRLYAGRLGVPRLPGELRAPRGRVLAAGRGLPRAPRQVGSPRPAAVEEDLTDCEPAAPAPHWVPGPANHTRHDKDLEVAIDARPL